ncbi:hypothetical protein IEQ34_021640 [Dendrobium chrysotoxum]|uniref:Uncharacterized protein n=1 Tax=Dendrobium chrysotoxum TaxID=161865 RepID=A0AAV7G6F9_DENCH|nr:hypothetical protein IEQ34_021640 [Dendrobium chrysotoxum]
MIALLLWRKSRFWDGSTSDKLRLKSWLEYYCISPKQLTAGSDDQQVACELRRIIYKHALSVNTVGTNLMVARIFQFL